MVLEEVANICSCLFLVPFLFLFNNAQLKKYIKLYLPYICAVILLVGLSLRSLHLQMSQSIKRSRFLWPSWNTGTSLKHGRSDHTASTLCIAHYFIAYQMFTFFFFLRCLVKICRWNFTLHLTQRSTRALPSCWWSPCSRLSWVASGVGNVRGEVTELLWCVKCTFWMQSDDLVLQLVIVNNFRLYRGTGQVLSFLMKITTFSQVVCVCLSQGATQPRREERWRGQQSR